MPKTSISSLAVTDTRYLIETPEGTDLPIDPAGICIRTMAFLFDSVVKYGVLIILLIILSYAGYAGGGLFLILFFLMTWFYSVLFEVFWQGQTPGKRLYKIRVVNEDGTPVTFPASLLRNLLRFIDFLPVAYMAAVVCASMNSRFQRLGDLAAGTIVTYDFDQLKEPKIDVASSRPVPVDFDAHEQRALLNFAERCPGLSKERQVELAQILQPVLNQADSVTTIKEMAKSLVIQK